MAQRSAAAPGQLEVVRSFVNTRDLEAGTDAIATSTALAGWLVGAGLLLPDEPVGPADVEAAGRLREALREALAANHDGRPLADEVVRALNDATRAAEISVAVTPSPGWAHRPAASGTPGAFGEILVVALQAMSADTWRRMKVCVNDTCRWAFYDHSRARSGKWCSMGVCGNRAKQQAWRRRRS
ncbi:MAG: CGNR zinc finger domain-containing protein [Acidimicrobiales bacterium]